MVYKKYIKRNGKLYGPYTYHSRRVNGKVISEYRGTSNNNYKNVLVFVFGILALILLAFFFFNLNGKITGYTLSEPNINLSDETMIYPVVYFTLISNQSVEIPAETEEIPEEIEEIPEESNHELNLNESDINNTNITKIPENESKELFNETIENEKPIIEPEEIINNSVEETTNAENVTQEITEDELVEEETPEITQEQSEKPAETSLTEEIPAPITGNIISKIFNGISNFFLGVIITGKTISELTTEIYGETSFDNPFVYKLKEGEIVQLVPGSVRTDSKSLDDNIIKFIYQGDEVFITTNYSEFAENISIINLTNQSQEIINPISFDITPLNNEEKEFLSATLGNISIQTINSELHNGRYEIEYKLGDYNVKYSYDAKISNESLDLEMEKDRIKWLRNIINKLSEEETTSEIAPQFILNYSLE